MAGPAAWVKGLLKRRVRPGGPLESALPESAEEYFLPRRRALSPDGRTLHGGADRKGSGGEALRGGHRRDAGGDAGAGNGRGPLVFASRTWFSKAGRRPEEALRRAVVKVVRHVSPALSLLDKKDFFRLEWRAIIQLMVKAMATMRRGSELPPPWRSASWRRCR